MRLQKSQSGFTPIHLLLLLVIFGIIGFAGWKVYDASKSVKPVESSNTPAPITKKEEPKISDGFVEYDNKELGFKFAYPKEWGTMVIEKNDNTNSGRLGQFYYGEFSDKKNVKLIYNTSDYDAFPGGGCALSRRVIVKPIDPAAVIENSKIIKAVNTDVRISNSQYYTDSVATGDCIADGDYDYATFNIKNSTYLAVQLRYEYEPKREQAGQTVFESVAKSISLN